MLYKARLLPLPGTDHAALVRQHCEAALDALAEVLVCPPETAHIHYDAARAQFHEASYHCAELAALEYEAMEQAKRLVAPDAPPEGQRGLLDDA